MEQKFDNDRGKYRKDVFFNGNIIDTRTNKEPNDIFTGPLDVFISDKWHVQGGNIKVANFLYEAL